MASFYSDGLQFTYATRGLGPSTFFFQHGIGGTHAQPLRLITGRRLGWQRAVKSTGTVFGDVRTSGRNPGARVDRRDAYRTLGSETFVRFRATRRVTTKFASVFFAPLR